MKLVKTTFFTSIITFVRIGSGFVSSKIVAMLTGPAGVAIIGAFSNFISIVLIFANGAINTGVVKYTAEYNGNDGQLKELFSTSLKISVYCSCIVGLLLIILAPYCSAWLLLNDIYTNVIRVLGITIILYSLNTLFISILNGKGQIKSYTIVNAAGSVIGLIMTAVLVYFFKVRGALYSLVLTPSIVFFVTASLIIRTPWFRWDYFKEAFNKTVGKKLSHFSLMAIVSAITVPVAQIVLRNIVIAKVGINSAGYWQGMMKVSDGYLLLITTSLSTYYLPKLSSLKTRAELRKEIFSGYKIILPAVLLGCCSIYFLRFIIIRVLYTPDFLKMEGLFIWQLCGDFFKISAWILAYLMLAKAMTRAFIFTEIIFSASYVVLGYVFLNIFHLKGITMAFAVNYFLYLITMILLFRKLLFWKKDARVNS
ncbi:O-antigen translocase [Mucilaginibacter sp. BT774]|uniref:O-antigen translocase n=1 Tax=Mucilaginibacter sp. BT774 TaxID=3062276 RepID=UPI0026748C23|nr:O-antigen translocase [Mucilaginibacter sp. BT774]MDO3625929.1 O-antigen translocase [Mucilaginibacter sp. BT774]